MACEGEPLEKRGYHDPFVPLVKGIIYVYRYTLSSFLGRHCRHLPTCSQYALEAFDLHGTWVGTWLTIARISRCPPGASAGLDPVPETIKSQPWWAPWRYGVWYLPAENRDTEE